MWIDLYLAAALLVAVAAWLVSPHFQSVDPPGDIARGFWSAAAGALWPLILIGAVQVYSVRFIARRLRPAHSEELDLAPLAALHDVSLRS
ncbi:hypothetical protein [Mycolicibacterium helvum]|uniref:Uncharacterized protein n=1 Tax=Mycolicibacterium helvum TaxID=1534349 RepID=A0A7I7T813_9MYCO|nr:hypothetical protein [Mycolicibacterium helvum]BBY64256.1 hypothetical protein MHEL_24990 [Mycolicibacterium helvum]